MKWGGGSRGRGSGQQWSRDHSVTLVGNRTNSRFVGRGAWPCSSQQWSRGHSHTLVGKRTNSRFVGWVGGGSRGRGSGQQWSRGNFVTLVGKWTNSRFVG